MSEFLEKIDAKRNRILEAALVEFADKGYKKASTNTIVREAKVSKGLLFHYFISKKNLYIYIFKHAKDTVKNDTLEKINFLDSDVLSRLRTATIAKADAYNNHKLFTKILEKHQLITDENIIKETSEIIIRNNEELFTKIFNNIDYYLFIEKININHSLKVIQWTIERITNDWKVDNNCKLTKRSLELLKMDVIRFLDLFTTAFYR